LIGLTNRRTEVLNKDVMNLSDLLKVISANKAEINLRVSCAATDVPQQLSEPY